MIIKKLLINYKNVKIKILPIVNILMLYYFYQIYEQNILYFNSINVDKQIYWIIIILFIINILLYYKNKIILVIFNMILFKYMYNNYYNDISNYAIKDSIINNDIINNQIDIVQHNNHNYILWISAFIITSIIIIFIIYNNIGDSNSTVINNTREKINNLECDIININSRLDEINIYNEDNIYKKIDQINEKQNFILKNQASIKCDIDYNNKNIIDIEENIQQINENHDKLCDILTSIKDIQKYNEINDNYNKLDIKINEIDEYLCKENIEKISTLENRINKIESYINNSNEFLNESQNQIDINLIDFI